MKKQINPTIKAHLIRSAFYVTLLLAVCVIPFALAQRNTTKHSAAPKGRPVMAAKGKAAAAADDDAEEPDKAGTIDKIDQMVGKRLGVIGRSPRNIELLKVILRQYRISPDQIVMLSSEDLKKPNAAGKISVAPAINVVAISETAASKLGDANCRTRSPATITKRSI